MVASADARALYAPLPPGTDPNLRAALDAWTTALDDCDPDAAEAALASAPEGATRSALLALTEVFRGRLGLHASPRRARFHASAALRADTSPLVHHAAGLAAAWMARTEEAIAHLDRVVAACGQPFAARMLAQIRIDRGDLAGASAALEGIREEHRGLRGLAWTRARLEAARSRETVAIEIASEILVGPEVPADGTNVDVLLGELPRTRRLPFLRSLHAGTGSALVIDRLRHEEALARTPAFRIVDGIGTRRWARLVLAAIFPGRAPPWPIVLLALLVFAPAAALRLLLLPWPLHTYLVTRTRDPGESLRQARSDLPRHGRVPLALWTCLWGSVVAALLHRPGWLVLSGCFALALTWSLMSIEVRMRQAGA